MEAGGIAGGLARLPLAVGGPLDCLIASQAYAFAQQALRGL